MATDDISRHLFRPEHHYTGVRMQQSRPLLDSDVNESEMLVDEDRRAAAVEIIGPHGSADDGFKIGAPYGGVSYNFDIEPGSYWLGGLRHEIGPLPDDPRLHLLGQPDWLQSSRDDLASLLPTRPSFGSRHDLVYMVGWEQSVSAVEDSELLELALGGPDTTSRIRRMHRVLVRKGVPGPGCAEAFAALVADHTGDDHTFDTNNNEIRSGARLTVVPSDPGDGDLCKPTVQKGYLGAEVQAIRVHCTDASHFLWGYDDTAPLYRIEIPTGSNTITITFRTPPRDSAHYPVQGQVIEILPWGAALPNGEKVADHHIAPEIGGGVFARVTKAYDPATRRLEAVVDNQTRLTKMTQWLANRSETDKYLYARVWNPGDGGTGIDFGVFFEPNVAVPLAGTGLELRFSAPAIPGDYWVLALRPSDPSHVVPWDLLSGAAPHGPRRFFCPLAMIAWEGTSAATSVATVHSCRRTFLPLTRQGGCCTVTVGDGSTSFGDYRTIGDALRALPADQPAKICVLPGLYEERVLLQSRSDLVIEGCGARTVISTPVGNSTSQGLITITACSNVTIRDLKIKATGQFGLMIFQTKSVPEVFSRDITLENLVVDTFRTPPPPDPPVPDLWLVAGPSPCPLSTIAAFLVDGLTVRGCTLALGTGLSAAANITLLRCSRVVVEASKISTVGNAWGGLNLGEGCEDALIEGNTIQSGVGHGITLGTAATNTLATDYIHVFDPPGRFVLAEGGAPQRVSGQLEVDAVPPGGGDRVALAIKAGLRDIRIVGNTIQYMGGSGIGVLGFRSFSSASTIPYEMIATEDLLIADNRIADNCLVPDTEEADADFIGVVALGGITLGHADHLRIRDNVIADNHGRYNTPVCGIYVVHGENIVIENNELRDNGVRDGAAIAGLRVGIALRMAGRRVTRTADGGITVGAERLLPAARIRGNVVFQPVGLALQIHGIGAMIVSNNVLVSQGLGVTASATAAHCVEIHNIGLSSEVLQHLTFPTFADFMPGTTMVPRPVSFTKALIDGRILFTDNQVRFSPATSSEAANVFCANRFHSYGDVALHDNQFMITYPDLVSQLTTDTRVAAWSARTTSNRWEDPGHFESGDYQTTDSARTAAALNITSLNQATRCFVITVAAGSPVTAAIKGNQTYTTCTE